MKEYVVYADGQEVLVQVIGDVIVSTGPYLRPFVNNRIKWFVMKCQERKWQIHQLHINYFPE